MVSLFNYIKAAYLNMARKTVRIRNRIGNSAPPSGGGAVLAGIVLHVSSF